MSDKKPEPKKTARAPAPKAPVAKSEPAVPQPPKASLRKQMRRMQASMPKEEKAVIEPGHGHRCNNCLKEYRHLDPKCIDIGLSWHVCPECQAEELAKLAPHSFEEAFT